MLKGPGSATPRCAVAAIAAAAVVFALPSRLHVRRRGPAFGATAAEVPSARRRLA